MRTEEIGKKKPVPSTLILLLLPSSLLAALNLAPGLHKDNSIHSEGIQRTFDYYIPAGLPTEAPLVLLLHGHGGDADGMTGENGKVAPFKVWMSIADTAKFICVYPEGEFSPIETNIRGWNDCRKTAQSNPNVDDVAFLTALIDTFGSYYAVTPQNSFVAGMSNGGFMAMRLATEVPEMFAGFAAVAASMPQTSKCSEPSIPASVLFMNGTKDPIMPFWGGYINGDTTDTRGDALSTWDAVNRWVAINQITSSPRIDSLTDGRKDDSTRVVKHSWESETNLKRVVLYEVVGGGHAEPSDLEEYSRYWQDGGWLFGQYFDGVGNQNHDIEMAHEIWKFFVSVGPASVHADRLLRIPNRTTIDGYGQSIYDLQGRRISARQISVRRVLISQDTHMAKKVIPNNF